jgi:hypothetical protein
MPDHDPAMKAKQRKAQMYATEPGRFTALAIQFEFRDGDETRIISYRAGVWECTCASASTVCPCDCSKKNAAYKCIHAIGGST